MPELPEVQTTVDGLNKKVKGGKIIDVWSIYNSPHHKSKENIKNPAFFTEFKKRVIGATIKKAERRAKNILIHLDNKETVLIHMKMTGHLMFGEYQNTSLIKEPNKNDPWKPVDKNNSYLNDAFNSHIRLVFSLMLKDNKRQLVLSDTRKFAKITVIKTEHVFQSPDLSHLGPEPLLSDFNFEVFKKQINKKPNGKIKTTLLDQTIISGVGNIYSDEALWLSDIHPESVVKNIPDQILKKLFKAILLVLKNGIHFGGDSMSDYRNIDGKKGAFQEKHNAYRKTGQQCNKKGCGGIIQRIIVGSRSSHYCDKHQTRY
jgi:formamidopyrimidine-DNA glycosylase